MVCSLDSVSRNGAINYSPQPYSQYVNTGSAFVSDKHLKKYVWIISETMIGMLKNNYVWIISETLEC